MANSTFRTGVLAALMEENGLFNVGISVVDIAPTPPVVNLQFPDSFTQQQKDLAATILAGFDWRKRRALDRTTVVTALQSLTTAQQNAVLRHVVCDAMRNNPALAAKIAAALSVALTVDEVDPN